MHGLLVYSLIRFIKVHKYQFKYHIADRYLTFQNLGTISTGFGKTKDQKMETVFRIVRKFTTSYFTHKIIDFETTKLMSGSFHFLFFVFWSKWPKLKKSAVLFVYFLYKKSTFCMKMTAYFLKTEWTRHHFLWIGTWNLNYFPVFPYCCKFLQKMWEK